MSFEDRQSSSEYRPTLQERQRQLREDAILDAAHELVSQQGYTEMSMDEVAAQVGISKATLYHHFPSKEDLVINVIVRSMHRGQTEMHMIDPSLPALDRLKQTIQRGLERKAGLWAARMTLMPLNVVKHPRFQNEYRCMMDELAQMIDAAKAEGGLVQDIPTPIIVRMISGLFRADYDDVLKNGTCSPAQLGAAIVEIVFTGLQIKREAKDALKQPQAEC